MLAVEVDSALDGLVRDSVAVREVFGENASTGLVFLGHLMVAG